VRFVQWCDWGRANDRKLQGIDFDAHKQYTTDAGKPSEAAQEPDDEGAGEGEEGEETPVDQAEEEIKDEVEEEEK